MFVSQHLRIGEDVLYQMINQEWIILNVQTGKYYGISGVGARLWQLFTQDGSVSRALKTIQDEYDVDGDVAAGDLKAFLDKLVDAGLGVVQGSGGRDP